MENIVTQEILPCSPAPSGDEEPVEGPLAQYYDVVMDLNQPQLPDNNQDSHSTLLFTPDPISLLHGSSDAHKSHHVPSKRCSDDGDTMARLATLMKRMKPTVLTAQRPIVSLSARRANRQLVDISTHQKGAPSSCSS